MEERTICRYFPWSLALALTLGCTGEVALVSDDPGSGGPGPSGGTVGQGGTNGTGSGGKGSSAGSSGKGSSSAGTGSGGTSSAGSGSGASGGTGEPVVCDDGGLHVGSDPVRRLSSTEYLNTLADLFPGASPELPELPTEAPVDSFDNDARALGPSDIYASRWEEIAFRYTNELTASASALEAFLPCASDASGAESERSCGAELIAAFGEKTHRRPLTSEERARYQELFDTQLAEIDFAAAVQLTAMAMLQSPWFLYRVEPDRAPAAEGGVALDSWELASRLSYFLWQRMPDQALLDAARNDRLTDPTELEAEARRMLADERARTAVSDFHRQWLYFDRILKEEHATRVDDLFPDWTADTQSAAYEELLRFTEHTVFEGTGTLSDLFLSRETELDANLAAIYGVDVSGSGFSAVTLPAEERAGLLTRVGFLAAHAHSANGSPPLRGSYVMQRLFCLKVDPPPPDADTTPPDPTGTSLTNREQFEERTSPPACGGCHAQLNSFGFGLEHYDAIGAYRDTDNGQPVNAAVTLIETDVDGEVNGGIELSQALASSTQVAECAVSRWFRYARGRGLEAEDQCTLTRLNERFAASGGNIVDLMVGIVTSPEFRHRAPEVN
ncbi:MAG TPA: DUF1592 domain-containing protein [Polyangiaceae bacterium]